MPTPLETFLAQQTSSKPFIISSREVAIGADNNHNGGAHDLVNGVRKLAWNNQGCMQYPNTFSLQRVMQAEGDLSKLADYCPHANERWLNRALDQRNVMPVEKVFVFHPGLEKALSKSRGPDGCVDLEMFQNSVPAHLRNYSFKEIVNALEHNYCRLKETEVRPDEWVVTLKQGEDVWSRVARSEDGAYASSGA